MLMRRTMDGEPLASATAAVKRDLWPVMKVGRCIHAPITSMHFNTHTRSTPTNNYQSNTPLSHTSHTSRYIQNDYKIWPLYDVLCFTMIPRHMQALTTGTLGICWATYLSFVTHTEGHESAAPAPAPVVAAAK